MARKRTVAELTAENKLLRRSAVSSSVTKVLTTAIRYGAVVMVVRYGYLAVAALAGQETKANILLEFLGNLTVSQWAAYILTGASLTYAARERRLRKSTVERLQKRVQQAEKASDPRRTSSRLTPRGDTHPRDAG